MPGFEPQKQDLIDAILGSSVLIGFAIMGVADDVVIYPYTTKFVIAPRDELRNLRP